MEPNRPDDPSWMPPPDPSSVPPPDPTRDTHSAWDTPDAATTPMPQSPAGPRPDYAPPAPSTAYPPYGAQGYGPGYRPWTAPAPSAWTPPPNNHLVWAILVTLFCFLPFGVVSIIKASSVNTLWAQGRWPEAYAAAASARTWAIWAMATVPLVFVIWVFGIVVATV